MVATSSRPILKGGSPHAEIWSQMRWQEASPSCTRAPSSLYHSPAESRAQCTPEYGMTKFVGKHAMEGAPQQSPTVGELAASADLHQALVKTLEMGVQAAILHLAGDPLAPFPQCIREFKASASCSTAVGYFTNAHIIGNLLHLIVQLSLFPKPAVSIAEKSSQHGLSPSDYCSVATQASTVAVNDAEVQTNETRQNTVAGSFHTRHRAGLREVRGTATDFDPNLGVRIGGGFHVCGSPSGERAASPPVEEVMAATVSSTAQAYLHGSPSSGVSSTRFLVGTYRGNCTNSSALASKDDDGRRQNCPHLSNPEVPKDGDLKVYRVLQGGRSSEATLTISPEGHSAAANETTGEALTVNAPSPGARQHSPSPFLSSEQASRRKTRPGSAQQWRSGRPLSSRSRGAMNS